MRAIFISSLWRYNRSPLTFPPETSFSEMSTVRTFFRLWVIGGSHSRLQQKRSKWYKHHNCLESFQAIEKRVGGGDRTAQWSLCFQETELEFGGWVSLVQSLSRVRPFCDPVNTRSLDVEGQISGSRELNRKNPTHFQRGLSSLQPSANKHMCRRKLPEMGRITLKKRQNNPQSSDGLPSEDFTSKFYQILEEKVIPIPYKLPRDSRGGGTSCIPN